MIVAKGLGFEIFTHLFCIHSAKTGHVRNEQLHDVKIFLLFATMVCRHEHVHRSFHFPCKSAVLKGHQLQLLEMLMWEMWHLATKRPESHE